MHRHKKLLYIQCSCYVKSHTYCLWTLVLAWIWNLDKKILFIQIKVEIEEFIKTVFTLFQGMLKIFAKSIQLHIWRQNFINRSDLMLTFNLYVPDLDFTFLEMNPFALVDGKPYPLDMRGELDDTAAFKNFKKYVLFSLFIFTILSLYFEPNKFCN